MKTFDKLYIDGAWVAPAGSDTLEVIDSTTEEVFATIPAGVPADIDRAVAAAKAAFPAWSEEPAPERGKLLRRVAEELEARRDEIADVITHEVGMPKGQSAAIQVGTGNLGVLDRIGARVDVRVRGHHRRARRAGADRRRRLHHAVELPAQPDRREGRVRARGRLHRRARSRRRSRRSTRSSSPRSSTTSASRPACSTWSRAWARSSARRWPRIPTSTWSRSPDRRARADASPSSRRSRSSGSRWSSAGSRRTCSRRRRLPEGGQGRRRRRVRELGPDLQRSPA